jgi:omega-amidase
VLRCAFIQTHLFWEDQAKNIEQLSVKINEVKPGTQLIILPEMFTTGFTMLPEQNYTTMDGAVVNWLKLTAQQKQCIITGSLIIKEDEHYYNRLLWVLPNGTVSFYDKRHLFAMAGEHKHYTPGQDKLIVSANGIKICLQVCYDLRFPAWASQQSDAELYDAIIYVANWPEQRIGHWNTLLQARAIENQCYAIGVNRVGEDNNGNYYNGSSTVIDPTGEILFKVINKEETVYFTLEKERVEQIRQQLPFLADRDQFTLLK